MNIKFFKKENVLKKKDFRLNSGFYWKIFVAGTFVAILFIFYFGYNLFIKINQESTVSSVNTNTSNGMINTNRIQKALDVFSTREKTSEQIINSPAPVVDPSL
jgi:hypothetical protein